MKDVSISIFPIEKIGMMETLLSLKLLAITIRSFLKLLFLFQIQQDKVPTCGGILARNFSTKQFLLIYLSRDFIIVFVLKKMICINRLKFNFNSFLST